METEDWTSSSDGMSDTDIQWQDRNQDDDCYIFGHVPKLQFRKDLSKACWVEELKMAEVVEIKGQIWKTTGIVRNGKIYCSIEEALFLIERGAMLLLDHSSNLLPLKVIYEKIAEGRSGGNWDSFQVYRHLRSLGFIIRRHGVPWTMKKVKSFSGSLEAESNGTKGEEQGNTSSIAESFNDMKINDIELLFDVYSPNSKFKKSAPGNPAFFLCLTRGRPPSKGEIEDLERQCSGIPLKVCQLEHGRLSYFSFNSVELPVLP